jgi:AAA domain
MPTLEAAHIEHLFCMLKGEPGTRKSTQALSFPTPQYWVSTDRKMEALTLPAKRWGIDTRQVDYDNYTDWDMPKAKLKSLQLNCKYKTIIVDSATSIGDNMTSQVKKGKRGDDKGKIIGNIQVSGLEEYNAESAAFQELIEILKDIHSFHKVNIILIAHVVGQRKNDDANKLTHHSRVIITGGDKISGKIASYMTEVYHFDVKAGFSENDEGTYGLYTSHTGNDYARTSLPLAKRIDFGNNPLYDTYLRPAIDALKAEKPIMRLTTAPQQGGTTSTPQPQPQTQFKA